MRPSLAGRGRAWMRGRDRGITHSSARPTRRQFVAGAVGLGAAAGLGLLAGCGGIAHEQRVTRVGVLTVGTDEPHYSGLVEGLREYGWTGSRTPVFERRLARETSQLDALALELALLPVDVIVAMTTDDARAAQR